jgi:hypothetical protein
LEVHEKDCTTPGKGEISGFSASLDIEKTSRTVYVYKRSTKEVYMPKSDKSQKTKAKAPVKRARVRPRWTSEEITILKRLYRTHSNAEIAKVLGRKVSSVVFKGHRLGLSKGIRRLKEMGRENIRRRWKNSKPAGKPTSRPSAAAAPRAPKGRRKAQR